MEEQRFQNAEPHKFTLESLRKDLDHWAKTAFRERLEEDRRGSAIRAVVSGAERDAALNQYLAGSKQGPTLGDLLTVPREFVSPSYYERTGGRNAVTPGHTSADVAPAPPSPVLETLDSRLCDICKKICLHHESRLLDDRCRGCDQADKCKFERNSKPVVTADELRQVKRFFRQNGKEGAKGVQHCIGYRKGKCENKGRGTCPWPHLSKDEIKVRTADLGL